MTIFEEVFAVAKVAKIKDQAEGQSEQDFLFSILKAVNTCPDDAWNALSVDAQLWADIAIKENNARKPIPEPHGYRDYWKKVPASIPVQTSVRVQSVVPNIANVPKSPNIANVPKAKPKPEGVVSAIRKTIILNPDWPTRKVHEYLVGNGWPNLKLDVVSVNAGDIRRTVAMVKDLNKWKD
jgi:hypothetical protein